MPQPSLDHAQVDPCFQQLGGPGVTQGMHRRMLLDPALGDRSAKRAVDGIDCHRLRCRLLGGAGGKEPDGMAMRPPVVTEEG